MANESNSPGDFSLESILAEIKGSAFINGDKKTPPDILEAEADRILREATQSNAPAAEHLTASEMNALADGYMAAANGQTAGADKFRPEHEPDFADTDDIPIFMTQAEDDPPAERTDTSKTPFGIAMDAASAAPGAEDSPTIRIQPADREPALHAEGQGEESDNRIVFIDHYTTHAEQLPYQDPAAQGRNTLFDQDTLADGEENEYGFEYGSDEDEIFEEPGLRDAAGRFAKACNSISLRCLPASVITLLMIVTTYVYEAGMVVPFGIGYSLVHAAGMLVLCLLFVMMLCVDIIVRGVDFLIRGIPNAETLILFSCAFSLISAVFTMLSGTAAMLPFCAVSALSLIFATYGERFSLRAITDTLKTAAGSSEPYGVQAEYNEEISKSVLKKTYNRTDGFYNNLVQPDITEILYRYAAPALLIAALLLTVLVVLINGGVENSLHILSAMLAAAAPFSALLSFSIPFGTVAKTARKSGAAIAGWGGADDICYTDGVCVTDDDLFPTGTLRLSGVKVYDGASPDKAILYTASLIITSGSGLTSLFSEVLKQQGLSVTRVDNFECHESGIGALIRGEHISTGSAAFMNLLGIRVPDDTSMKNAVYTAVNGRLVAMFAIDYKPLPSVQNALISILKWRIDLFFAMRDFNVTPAMVGQKFKVPFEGFVFIPAKDSYSISDPYSGKHGRMSSILIREGLGPFADAVTGGKLLRSASLFATILSIVSAALGVIIMFLMCWSGSFKSASPGNLVVFMLCMLATVLIVCGYVRLKK